MRCYLIVNLTKENAPSCARDAIALLCQAGAQVILTPETAVALGEQEPLRLPDKEAMEACDIAISIGGDGTLLHAAIDALMFDKPVIGINSGRLGYLTQIERPLENSLSKLAAGQFSIQPRTVLEAEILQKDGSRQHLFAINDIVIARNTVANMIDIEVERGRISFASYRADGLIIATPTGSTAYSMSAGGAIVDPNMECLIMTPICPHSLADRSVVLTAREPLHVRLITRNTMPDAGVSVDGAAPLPMVDGTELYIYASAKRSLFVQLDDVSFYKTLGQKLIGK